MTPSTAALPGPNGSSAPTTMATSANTIPTNTLTTAAAVASTANGTTSGSRARTQSRRRPNDDDAAYVGQLGGGSKRAAVDRADGEPRQKRKRVDPLVGASGGAGAYVDRDRHTHQHPHQHAHHTHLHPVQQQLSHGGSASARRAAEKEDGVSLVNFANFTPEALHRYLSAFDLVPDVHPSPCTAEDPPPAASLLRRRRRSTQTQSQTKAAKAPQPQPVITPANRPRRDKDAAGRRRSTRLAEEGEDGLGEDGDEEEDGEGGEPRTPVLADKEEVHRTLASVCQRHFRAQVVREVDTLASFMCALKARAGERGELRRIRMAWR